MKRFENKVVVITGAAGGIGEATTRRIVSEGGKVVIADHSQERADKLAANSLKPGADVRPIYSPLPNSKAVKNWLILP